MSRSKTPVTDLLLHPVRWSIVQRAMGREVTTTQLRAELPDVSTTSLYRQITTLLDAGVLHVVREERVRGAIERTLALRPTEGLRAAGVDEAEAMSPEQHRVGLSLLLAQTARDLERSIERGDLVERTDELSYGQTALYVSPEELPGLQAALDSALAPYLTPDGAEGRRRIMLSVVAIPDA